MKKDFSVILITAALTLGGLVSLPGLGISEDANHGSSTLNVWFSNSQLSARGIEKEITSRIESLCSTINGVSGTSSHSADGSGWVNAELRKGTDFATSRFDASLKIRQLRRFLPEGTYIDISGNMTGDSEHEIMTWTVISKLPGQVTDSICRAFLTEYILDMEGIGQIIYQPPGHDITIIQADPAIERYAGLGIPAIQSAILGSQPAQLTGSTAVHDGNVPVVLTVKQPSAGDNLVRNSAGRLFRVKDVALVSQGTGSMGNISRINGLECSRFTIHATQQANAIRVCRKIRDLIQNAGEKLPDGVYMECTSDASAEITGQIISSMLRSGASLAILLLALWAIYRNRKYSMIVMFSLFADISITILICRIAGIGIDVGTLSALAISLGMLIDTSIVMASHYIEFRNKRAATGVLTAVLTTVASLLLAFLLPREMRKDIGSFIWATSISLCVSFLVAWISVPAMIECWGYFDDASKPTPRKRLRLYSRLQKFYTRCIVQFIRFRVPIGLALLLMAAVSIPISFRQAPRNAESDYSGSNVLLVRANLEQGKPEEILDEALSAMERRIALFPQISRFNTFGYGTQGAISITFAEGTEPWETHEIRDSIWQSAMKIPSVSWTVPAMSAGQDNYTTYIGTGSPVESISLYGYDYEQLHRYASIILDSLTARSRVRDAMISTDRSSGTDHEEYSFSLDKQIGALMGISNSRIMSGISRSGFTHTPASHPGYGIMLRNPAESDAGLWLSQNHPLPNGDAFFRMGNVGKLEKSHVSMDIVKENQEYVAQVKYNYIGDYLTHNSLRSTIIRNIAPQFPLGFHIDKNMHTGITEKQNNTFMLAGCVLAVIFLICCAMFNSIRIALAIITLIPSSLSGIFILCIILGIRPDQSCLAAIVVTCGLAVNSGIYIAMEYMQDTRLPGPKRFARAFGRKSIPTAMTILSTMLGLTPFLFSGQKDGFWFMLSAGIIAGLLFSCIGLLVLLPAFISLKKLKKSSDFQEKGYNFTPS